MAMAKATASLRRLTQRSQFLRAARGNRAGRAAFGLQAIPNATEDAGVGFTVTKKTGNAPERNRIKRRLRAAVTICASDFVPGHDYVLVGRREALGEPFAKLAREVSQAIAKVHKARPISDPSRAPCLQADRNSRP